MPREILSSSQTADLLSKTKVNFVHAESSISHSEILYEIKETAGIKPPCDICGRPGSFLHHTRDHEGKNFVTITCINDSPPGYERLKSLKISG